MQLMSWTLARLGSRFGLFFEPHRRRVMHSALGRFLDQPLDLMVGLVEPDGTERTLPLTQHGSPLLFAEQSERLNSITFRGMSERYCLRFEFNIHSVLYPRDEALCLMPAFYLEVRVHPAERVQDIEPTGATPDEVELFLRLGRDETRIRASSEDGGRIDMHYEVPLTPRRTLMNGAVHTMPDGLDGVAQVSERIVSLNTDELAEVDDSGRGLRIRLPVTEPASGVKWRLVWGAFCGDTVLEVAGGKEHPVRLGRLRYTQYWDSLDAVMDEAIGHRDEHLARSRRMEKLTEQSPLRTDERHLINQTFQAFLGNTWWCDLDDGSQWFSIWDGGSTHHSALDGAFTNAVFYMTLWPSLLGMQLNQWGQRSQPHEPSDGAVIDRDMGTGLRAMGRAMKQAMPVESNCNFLLLHAAYAHWTGDLSLAQQQAELIDRVTRYLIWCDRDNSGFPTAGFVNAILDGSPTVRGSRKQTYLAVKRLSALNVASDLLLKIGRGDVAEPCDQVVTRDGPKIEARAWLGDHYVICSDSSAIGLSDPATGSPLAMGDLPFAEGYSIYTGHGTLLPLLWGQPTLLDRTRLLADIISAERETISSYGCAHSSADAGRVAVSQNLWRDHLARYLGATKLNWTAAYWDLQVMANTGTHSFGFIDAHASRDASFSPRGVTALGMFLGYPRLVIDRLAPGGQRISIDPDRHYPQRWPLFPLADWKAGKIPVCVVDRNGRVFIESPIDPVVIKGDQEADGMIG